MWFPKFPVEGGGDFRDKKVNSATESGRFRHNFAMAKTPVDYGRHHRQRFTLYKWHWRLSIATKNTAAVYSPSAVIAVAVSIYRRLGRCGIYQHRYLFVRSAFGSSKTTTWRRYMWWRNRQKITTECYGVNPPLQPGHADKFKTRSSATAKSTARSSCLVGVIYDLYREKICYWLINHFYVIRHESYKIRRNNAK